MARNRPFNPNTNPVHIGQVPGLLGSMWDNMDMMDRAALVTSPVPVVGDVGGLLNDTRHFINEPESRTPGNFALSAAGLLPFVPPVMGITTKAGKYVPFKKETGTPNIDDVFKNPDYYRDNKGVELAYEEMKPRRYINEAAHGFGVSYDDIVWGRTQDGRVEKYIADMQRGDEFPALWLDKSDPAHFGQEGLHRAIAAERLGYKHIPVYTKNKYIPPPPPKTPEQLKKEAVEIQSILDQLLDDFS